ncbi:MAG TPA: SDR family oxidoreductase [Caulobacteraceae bacterium]|jgi:nucleoside-diphosphate-sugar epimerase
MSPVSGAKTVLIAGASGVIGAAAVEHFAKLPDWRVIGVSRRRPDLAADIPFDHIRLDLMDAAACRAASPGFSGVTHLIYAALFEKPGLVKGWCEADQMQTNLAMMRHLTEPLLQAATGLRHISVLQGTKAYGAHVHRVMVPAREDGPRDPHENFYWLQEDHIRQIQQDQAWDFTIWRPQIVFGGATGVAMNLIPVLGAYAAICRELDLPFLCPGLHDNIIEAVDADLIARALAWAAHSDAAKGQTFNITNGDVMVWPNAWPTIAKAVGLEPVFDGPVSLVEFLAGHAETWDRIVQKHGLRPIPLAGLLGESDHYADLLFSYGAQQPPASILVSTIKLRQAGFGDCVDTAEMFRRWLRRLAERNIIPDMPTPAG